MAYPKVKLSDNAGTTVDVTENNELKVKLSDSVTVTAEDLSIELTQDDEISTFEQNTLVPHQYDYIALAYTDGDLTQVEYYTGGSGGTLRAHITLGYTDGLLTTVTKLPQTT